MTRKRLARPSIHNVVRVVFHRPNPSTCGVLVGSFRVVCPIAFGRCVAFIPNPNHSFEGTVRVRVHLHLERGVTSRTAVRRGVREGVLMERRVVPTRCRF